MGLRGKEYGPRIPPRPWAAKKRAYRGQAPRPAGLHRRGSWVRFKPPPHQFGPPSHPPGRKGHAEAAMQSPLTIGRPRPHNAANQSMPRYRSASPTRTEPPLGWKTPARLPFRRPWAVGLNRRSKPRPPSLALIIRKEGNQPSPEREPFLEMGLTSEKQSWIERTEPGRISGGIRPGKRSNQRGHVLRAIQEREAPKAGPKPGLSANPREISSNKRLAFERSSPGSPF